MKKPRPSLLLRVGMIVTLVAVTVVLFGQNYSDATVNAPLISTARVKTGDILLTASGIGSIEPYVQIDLTFPTSGVISTLDVKVGENVTAGQVLSRLEGYTQAAADFQSLFSHQGIAQASLALADAETALAAAERDWINLIGAEAWYWEGQIREAEINLETLLKDPLATEEDIEQARFTLESAQGWSAYWQEFHMESLESRNKVYDVKTAEITEFHYVYYKVTDRELITAQMGLDLAGVLLLDAQTAMNIVLSGPQSLQAPLTILGPQTQRLEQVRQALAETQLTAPFDGTITLLNGSLGQNAGASSVMTISSSQLMIRFYLEQSDLSKAVVGNPVIVTSEAYPDLPLNGQIVMVEPTVQTVDGVPVVVVWAALVDETEAGLRSGMSVEVEVIAEEVRDALLVPVQALQEVSPGSYVVNLVLPDGSLKATPVTVGLRDYANAVILGGLKAGDIVSTAP